jgi:DNA-binding helix-hairpin-helix protein with protein kinase domain
MRSTGEMSKRLDEAEASLAQARKDLEAVSANRDHWKASAKECPHCLGQGTILGNECGCGGKR